MKVYKNEIKILANPGSGGSIGFFNSDTFQRFLEIALIESV